MVGAVGHAVDTLECMTTHQLAGRWGQGAVTEIGACVMSWAPVGFGELLFVSKSASMQVGQMWHGGIPVCAPWFGLGRGDWQVPHGHGLVSRVVWTLDSVEEADDAARLTLSTDARATAHLPGAERYPDDLGYRLDITMGSTLELALTVSSPTRDVVVDQALHPYFRLDAQRAHVEGLEGVRYVDFAADAQRQTADGPVGVGVHLDRVYDAAPATRIVDGHRELRLDGAGASSVVVWNPGPCGSLEDEWQHFACVEYGTVQGNAVTIAAGSSHTLGMRIVPRD